MEGTQQGGGEGGRGKGWVGEGNVDVGGNSPSPSALLGPLGRELSMASERVGWRRGDRYGRTVSLLFSGAEVGFALRSH